MNDTTLTKGHYSKSEILDVIHGVSEMLGTRRRKILLVAEINKIRLEKSFLEQQLAVTREKLAVHDKELQKAEADTLDSRNVYLNLRAAGKTAQFEYKRLEEISKKCRQAVEIKYKEQLENLQEALKELENQSLPMTRDQIGKIRTRITELEHKKEKKTTLLNTILADYRHTLNLEGKDFALLQAKVDGLEQTAGQLKNELERGQNEQDGLTRESASLDEDIVREEALAKELTPKLASLRDTKERIERIDNVEEYMANLEKEMEDMRLGIAAKKDIAKVITDIQNEVDRINKSLAEGIEEFEEIFNEFERSIPSPASQ